MLKVTIVVGLVFGVFFQNAQAQATRPLRRCEGAEMIVNGAVSAYQAKQHGASYEQQVKAVQLVAGKLAGTFGESVAKSYGDTEIKVLQSLYNNLEYSSMSPQQYKDAIGEAFYRAAGCPLPTSL